MAAGKGKRMKSDLPKVLHQLAGKPLVHHVIELAKIVGSSKIVLIIGHKRELVIEQTKHLEVEWVVQEQQLGTGDAVRVCKSILSDFMGDVLVLSGDVPLLRPETVTEAWKLHRETESAATVFTFEPEDPTGYGRVVRGSEGELNYIVEHKDANEEEKAVREVNGGIYFFRNDLMFKALEQISNDNASNEYYLTDTISVLRNSGYWVSAFLVKDRKEMAGINSKEQLQELEQYFKLNR